MCCRHAAFTSVLGCAACRVPQIGKSFLFEGLQADDIAVIVDAMHPVAVEAQKPVFLQVCAQCCNGTCPLPALCRCALQSVDPGPRHALLADAGADDDDAGADDDGMDAVWCVADRATLALSSTSLHRVCWRWWSMALS